MKKKLSDDPLYYFLMHLSREWRMPFSEMIASLTEEELVRQLAFAEYLPLPDPHIQVGLILEMIGASAGCQRFDPLTWHPSALVRKPREMSEEQVFQKLHRLCRQSN